MFSVHFDLTLDAPAATLSFLGGAQIDPARTITGNLIDPLGDSQPFSYPTDGQAVLVLPTDLNQKVLYGDYRVTFADDGTEADEGVYPLEERTQPRYPLGVTTSSLTASIRVEDGGSYLASASIERTFTLERPRIEHLDVPARKDSYRVLDQPAKEIAVGYSGVPYSIYLDGKVTGLIGDNIQVTEAFGISAGSHTLSSGQSLTNISQRVRDFVADELSLAAAQNQPVSPRVFSRVVLLTTLLSRLLAGVHILDSSAAQESYRRISDIIGPSGSAQRVERIGLDGTMGYPTSLPDNIIRSSGPGLAVTQSNDRYLVSLSETLSSLEAAVVERGGGGIDLRVTPEDYQTFAISASLLPQTLAGGGPVGDGEEVGDPSASSLVKVRRTLSTGGNVEITGRIELRDQLFAGTTFRLLAQALPEEFRPRISSLFAPVFDIDGDWVGSIRCGPDGNLVLHGKRTAMDPPLEVDPEASIAYSFFLAYNPAE